MVSKPESSEGITTSGNSMADELRADIANDRFRPGERLPSQRELATRYGVARNTAINALKVLEAEGLIETSDRSGSRVRQPKTLIRMGAERYSNRLRRETGLSPYRAELSKQNRIAKVDCTSIDTRPAPLEVAQRLNLDVQEDVVRRENWYFAGTKNADGGVDYEPTQVGITYIPTSIAANSVLAHSTDMGPGSLYGRFEELGHTISSVREEVTSRTPTKEEKDGLGIPATVPILEVIHTGFDQNDCPFEVTVFTMRSDVNGLDYRIPVDD